MKSSSEILKKYFGYDSFRPLQEEIISELLNGKDAMVLMPTGGGKSLCFQIPALMLEGTALIISPLISLMKDQVDALRTNGISASFINSSMSRDEETAEIEKCLRGEIKLLYLSPERAMADLTGWLAQLKVSLIAIDEAHCVSQWGHDFRPVYKVLHQLRESFSNAPLITLTATADKLTRIDILSLLGLREPKQFVSSFDRPNISLAVKFGMNKRDKIRDIYQFISKHKNESGIIYCTSRASTEEVAIDLKEFGIDAKCYHAGMSSDDRTKVQEDFINDEVQVVCATIAFGMGIDKSNVRFVLHYNLPKALENYFQEIGRGGRDGLKCDTILYFSIGDLIMLRKFAEESGQPQINLEKLERMKEYAEAQICRRKILLNYFGENLRENCNNCDVCGNPPKHFDGKLIAQKALSALKRIDLEGKKAGAHLLIDVLRGMRNQEVLLPGLDKIKTYGAGADMSAKEWSHYILQMIQIGLMEIAYDDGNTLRITSFGDLVLKGTVPLSLVIPTIEETKIRITKSKVHPYSNRFSEPTSISLFETLRQLRKEIANKINVPPHAVFSDSVLVEMEEQQPMTEDELMKISGLTESKLSQFGNQFLSAITNFKKYKPKYNVDEILSEENLKRYMIELKEKGIKFTRSAIGKLLTGSNSGRFPEEVKSLSFFGLLENKMTATDVGKRINEFYRPYVTEENAKRNNETTGANDYRNSLADNFFSKETFNQLSESQRKSLKENIDAIPFSKPTELMTNAELIEKRKTHPRHMELWSEREKEIITKAIRYTNDLHFLIHSFGRNEASIRATVGNILLEKN